MFESKTAMDVKQFSIKPSDIGYETETAEEITPTLGKTDNKTMSKQSYKVNTRPPLMLYPGE